MTNKNKEIRYPYFSSDDITVPNICYFNYANGTMHKIIFFKSKIALFNPFTNGFFIGIEQKGCFLFNGDRWVHAEYAAEKLNLCLGDAFAMADFINIQIGRYEENEGTTPRQQGTYDESTMLGGEHYYEWYGLGQQKLLMINPQIYIEQTP